MCEDIRHRIQYLKLGVLEKLMCMIVIAIRYQGCLIKECAVYLITVNNSTVVRRRLVALISERRVVH